MIGISDPHHLDGDTAAQFKAGDAASYDPVVETFEALTQQYTALIAGNLLRLVTLRPGMRVLDVGCGTGVLAAQLAEQRRDLGRICGVDLSTGMLETARRLAAERGLGGAIEFVQGDAEHLGFEDASFDAVVSLYALRHFPDPAQAIREMRRVCRPGGQVVVGVGSGAPLLSPDFVRRQLERLADAAGSAIRPRPLEATGFLDRLVDEQLGTPDTALDAAWTHGRTRFDSPVAALMREADFRAVRVSWAGQSARIASSDDFWRLQITLSTRARKRYAQSTPEQQRRLREAFDLRCAEHRARGGRMIYRSGALLTRGVRPPSG